MNTQEALAQILAGQAEQAEAQAKQAEAQAKAQAKQAEAQAEQAKEQAEERALNAEFRMVVISELELLKAGIIMIGGKPVSDLYGITETTKNDMQTEAQAFADSTTKEQIESFVESCHNNEEGFRSSSVSVTQIGKEWKPDAAKSELNSAAKWVSSQFTKMFGARPCFQINAEVGKRRQSACYYPATAAQLINLYMGYYFSERTNSSGEIPARMY